MRQRRTVQPLPRYTLRKPLSDGGWGYYFNPPSWSRSIVDERGPCPVGAEDLGADYAAAVDRAETVLLKAWDAWRTGGALEPVPGAAPHGTLDWLFGEYRASERFRRLNRKVKALHELI